MYTEYLIEIDNENLCVYISGLDEDDYWEEFAVHEAVNNPEEFAEGIASVYRDQGEFVTITFVTDDEDDFTVVDGPAW